MHGGSNLLDIIGRIYDAAMEPAQWPEALGHMADNLGADTSVLYLVDTARPEVGFLEHARRDDALMRSYSDYYVGLDPWVDFLAKRPAGRAYMSQQALNDAAFERTEFCNDLCRPLGIFNSLGGFAHRRGSVALLCGLQRRRSKGPFGNEERQRLERLFPHLARASDLHRTFHGLRATSDAARAVLDRLPWAVMILGEDRHLLHANRRAEALLREADGLSVHNGCLRLAVSREQAALNRLINRTLATASGASAKGVGVLSISRLSLRRPYALQALPARAGDWISRLGLDFASPAVFLFVSDPEQRTELPRVALRRLYGLTPAEARLAQALVAGEHLNDIAEHLGTTKETARSQLKAVFAKTDTHRQAELVRVLLLGVGRFAANGTAIDGSGLDR